MNTLMTALHTLPGKHPELDAFLASPYAAILQTSLDALMPQYFYPSPVHGQNHNERVLLYGCMIGWHEGFDDADMRILCDGCAYHDIGRVDDEVDDFHGQRSADRIHHVLSYENEQELRILRSIMEAHSKNDKLMPVIFSARGVEDHARALRIARALKDADALDRVRVDKLDPSYLRYDYSKTLVKFSWVVCRHHMMLYIRQQEAH